MIILSMRFTGVYSQDNVINYFDQFTQNYNLINPGAKDSTINYIGQLGNKTQIGLFSGLSHLYFDGDIKLQRKAEKSFHFIGVQFINNREGAFITRNRVYGRYAWFQQLNQKSTLSAGISLGAINYAFQNSQGGVSGSDFAPDGNIGVEYSINKLKVGLSLQQFLNAGLQPIDEKIRLKQFYNLHGNYQFTLTDLINLNLHALLQLGGNSNTTYSISPLIELQNRYELGINYRHQNGFVFLMGLKNMELINAFFSVYASYKTATNTVSVSDNALEIYLSFYK